MAKKKVVPITEAIIQEVTPKVESTLNILDVVKKAEPESIHRTRRRNAQGATE